MNRLDETAEQTEIRRRLLANGYAPLANKDKMCVLPGWPGMHIDEVQIDVWSQQLKWRATGVRVENGLHLAGESIIGVISANGGQIAGDVSIRVWDRGVIDVSGQEMKPVGIL